MTKTNKPTRKKKLTKKAIRELFDGIALEFERLNRHAEAENARRLKALY